MAENSTRVRKRQRRAPDTVINYTRVRGHTTNPFPEGTDVDNTYPIWFACLQTSTEWCEDVNHREHYRIDGDAGVATLIGTMTTRDRGSPLWVRRAIRTHTPGGPVEWKTGQGEELGSSGNWSTTTQTGHQLIGYASYGSGFDTDYAKVSTYGGALPEKNLINFGLYGPKGWRRYQPLNPKASTTQFLAELRDLPRLPLEFYKKAQWFKSLGSEYLNVVFGWKPFIQDVQDFCKAVLAFDERYRQLVRDNGKPVHREGPIFKTIDTSSTHEDALGEILLPGYHIDAYGGSLALAAFPSTKDNTTVIEQEYWFSGTFRYWLAPFESTRFTEQLLRVAYGVDFSPRLFWELMPWSWLFDWTTSIGDSIANFTEVFADGLVAEYAYVMGRYRSVSTDTWRGPLSTAKTSLIQEIKARDQATPYGFGLNTSDFTDAQKAILVALALSRT